MKSNSTLSALLTLIPLLALALAGCGTMGTTSSRIADPIQDASTQVAPGAATRDSVRWMLGPPLWASQRWRAELYSGEAVMKVWHHDPFYFPYRSSERSEPATLLVVFGPDDVVSGTAYSGPGCGACGPTGKWGAFKADPCPGSTHACVAGDLRGLDIVSHHILLAPAAASHDLMAEAPPSSRCALLVAQSDKNLGGFDLYLDDGLLQRLPREPWAVFLRVDIAAGQHTLACTDGRPVWNLRNENIPMTPGQDWPGGEPRRGQRLVIDCPADGQALYRLVNPGRFSVSCRFVPVDAAAFPAAISGARLAIVPDRPE